MPVISSRRPLPQLPLETQAAILRFCDVSTLAVSSRVSLAWLELAGPVLYEHITITGGKKQLDMMIRSTTLLASVAPFVSLDQTRTFTYRPTRFGALANRDISSKLTSDPVTIEMLIVDLRIVGDIFTRLDEFLASFNPRLLHVLAHPTSQYRVDVYLAISPRYLAWSQLRKVTFTHSLFSNGSPADIPTLVDRSPPLELEYDIPSRPPKGDDLANTLKEVLGDLTRPSVQATPQRAIGHVQVWVHNEEEVKFAKKKLVGCSCTSLDIAVKTH